MRLAYDWNGAWLHRYNLYLMKTIPITVPDELAAQLRLDDAQLAQELRWLIAVKLYELGRISAGVAAEMVGANRAEFLERLAEFQVSPINLDADALTQEFEVARATAQRLCNGSQTLRRLFC